MDRLVTARRPEPGRFLRAWVTLAYTGRASGSRDTQAEAIARAEELAKKRALGQVIIDKQDGTIQTEHR